MKVVAIIQARMGSTRLPGKVLMKVLEKPLLEYQLERVKRSKRIDQIIVATTSKQMDQPIIDLCNRLGIETFRGSEEDVLERYYEAANLFNADIIVRLTSDCPLIDPEVIDKVIGYFLDHYPKYDYVSNTIERTYPRGMDTEVFKREVLQEANEKAKEKMYREHVTSYIYTHSHRFNIGSVKDNLEHSDHRWTVDTPADFTLISTILSELYPTNPHFDISKIYDLMNTNPSLKEINRDIKQKEL